MKTLVTNSMSAMWIVALVSFCLFQTRVTYSGDQVRDFVPPNELKVFFLMHGQQPESQGVHSDVFQCVIGEEIRFFVLVENRGNIPFAYDSRFFRYPYNYIILEQTSKKTKISPIEVRFMQVPRTQDDIVILNPNERQSHEVFLCNLFPWGLPEQGQWGDRQGYLGMTGKYQLTYQHEVRSGWKQHLNEAGFSGNFFEGTMRGQVDFSIVPPPQSSKKELLEQLEDVLNNPPETPMDEKLVRVFLQNYYLSPKEFQDILLQRRNFTLSANTLMACYFGLSMFDTPEAKDAIESLIRQQNKNSLSPATGETDSARTDFETVIHRTIIMRWIALFVFIAVGSTAAWFALRRYKLTSK